MRLRTNKISFRLPGIEKRFFLYRKEVVLLSVSFVFAAISLILIFKNGLELKNWMWFFPSMFIVYVLTIIFRPKTKFTITRTAEQWDAILKGNGPFIYTQGGFIVDIENKPRVEIKWNSIDEIIAFRSEYFAHDEIGIQVKVNNDDFSITENTSGWMMFINKMKENLTLLVPEWFGEIQTSKESITVYKKERADNNE